MEKKCPPHRFPHRLPWQEEVANEKCHVPEGRIKLFFHNMRCWMMQCPYRNWK